MERLALRVETRQVLAELIDLVTAFSDEEFNTIPFENSWTAGQLCLHVVIVNGGFIQMLNGTVKDTERLPDAKVEQLRGDFMNFGIKMKAPENAVPQLTNYEKDNMLRTFEKIKTDADQAITTLDLTQTCTSSEIPVYGFLTRLEVIYFLIFHTKRHIHQLKNIRQHVADLQKA